MALVTAVHIVAAGMFLVYLARPSRGFQLATQVTIVLAFLLNTSHMALRLAQTSFATITTPTGAQLLAWLLVGFYLVVSLVYRDAALFDFGDLVGKATGMYFAFHTTRGLALTPLVLPTAAALLAFGSVSSVPAPLVMLTGGMWRSAPGWLVLVAGAFLSFACWTGVVYLMCERLRASGQWRNPHSPVLSLVLLDMLAYQLLLIGFFLQTLGFIMASTSGPQWALPGDRPLVQGLVLLTWFVYATQVYGRYVAGWRGRRCAVLSILGFTLFLATFLGVPIMEYVFS